MLDAFDRASAVITRVLPDWLDRRRQLARLIERAKDLAKLDKSATAELTEAVHDTGTVICFGQVLELGPAKEKETRVGVKELLEELQRSDKSILKRVSLALVRAEAAKSEKNADQAGSTYVLEIRAALPTDRRTTVTDITPRQRR